MPRTDLVVGDYAEFQERICRITEICTYENDPLTPYAKLVEIFVDENGQVTEGSPRSSDIVLYALRPIVYPTIVMQLAIHDRQQELDDQVKRTAQLKQEIESLKLALGVIQHNENINRDPDD